MTVSLLVNILGSLVTLLVALPILTMLHKVKVRLAGDPYPWPDWVYRLHVNYWAWRAKRHQYDW